MYHAGSTARKMFAIRGAGAIERVDTLSSANGAYIEGIWAGSITAVQLFDEKLGTAVHR